MTTRKGYGMPLVTGRLCRAFWLKAYPTVFALGGSRRVRTAGIEAGTLPLIARP